MFGNWHQLGTTRMHPDPARGVVDENCRVHEMSNLYIAGGSVFPTGGDANPSLTIVALSLRLADHLKSTTTQKSSWRGPPADYAISLIVALWIASLATTLQAAYAGVGASSCPANAIAIAPGTLIQEAVDRAGENAVLCLKTAFTGRRRSGRDPASASMARGKRC